MANRTIQNPAILNPSLLKRAEEVARALNEDSNGRAAGAPLNVRTPHHRLAKAARKASKRAKR